MSSILNDTKKVLGVDADYEVFDVDILMHLNAALAVATQLGVGPQEGYYVEDSDMTWDELGLSQRLLNVMKTFLHLKVRMLFDPPTTSFMITAAETQLKEYESRLNYFAEIEAL